MKRTLAVLALLLAGCWTGCSYTDEGDQLPPPTAPGPPTPCVTTAPEDERPDVVNAIVDPDGCVAGDCAASYAVTAAGAARFSWSFVGGSPASSEAQSGVVVWRGVTSLPTQKSWSSTACGCARENDQANRSCTTVTGTVIFE